MDVDAEIGRKIAELRSQQQKTQHEFLAELAVQGVAWTQTTLSRIESGKRAVKLSEALAIADVLGVSAGDLGPDGNELRYRIEALMHRAWQAGSEYLKARRYLCRIESGIAALRLVDALERGGTDFLVHTSPRQLVRLIADWEAGVDAPHNSLRAGLEALDVDPSIVSGVEVGTPEFDKAIEAAVQRRHPSLRFDNEGEWRFNPSKGQRLRIDGLPEYVSNFDRGEGGWDEDGG
ncbi:transcriptional regulator with XRE-family HTH domain [Rhodococcus sp. LBL1]|nr:transcriptional regulator with XRE-family HTH domain [Rhodococcus sp. LBL1]MDH6684009.1 transcriptional regulator with XRE-family HTH domain [Rhodococcus sp. LBL2]